MFLQLVLNDCADGEYQANGCGSGSSHYEHGNVHALFREFLFHAHADGARHANACDYGLRLHRYADGGALHCTEETPLQASAIRQTKNFPMDAHRAGLLT